MNAQQLMDKLATLKAQRPVTVLGAAVIDVIADAYALPWRGCDIELQQQSVNVGGCALNIAVTLKRLGIDAQNALPIGQGVWAEIIRQRLAKEGLTSVISQADGDNGWCLALVEPDGERTFMSFSGVENQWCDAWLERVHALRQPGLSFRLSAGIRQRRTTGLLAGTAAAGKRLYRLWPADCRYSRNADDASDGPEATGFRQPPGSRHRG